ncbi:MAG: hypothetical protein ABI186_04970 [Candidatus Elarobacter sp.]
MMNQLHDTLQLHAGEQDAPSRVASAVDAILAAGEDRPSLSVVLDGDLLPVATISALVTGLRRLREFGGALEVRPGSPAVRDALSLTGLDRVFALPLVPEDRVKPGHTRNVLTRFTAAAFAGLVALAAIPASAAADRSTDPPAILAKIAEQNPSLSSYQSRLHVELRMTSFPFVRQHLDGTTYYKRPSNYEVVFDRVPALAKGFDKMFSDVGDPSSWERRFVVTADGERDYNGHTDLALRLVQRVRGMIDHEAVLVDPTTWTVDSIRYDYYNGGHITMTQTFRDIGGYRMLAEQNAEIAIPYAKAVAHGVYSDYKTNVAVDDSVFTTKKN